MGRCFRGPGIPVGVEGGLLQSHRDGQGGEEGGRSPRNRPCGRAASTKCRRRTWRRRLCYPARRRSSKWQRRENVAQREMRDKGGSAAPAGTTPGRLRPGQDSSPGSHQLLLLLLLVLYNFATLIGSPSAGSVWLVECPRDRQSPWCALHCSFCCSVIHSKLSSFA